MSGDGVWIIIKTSQEWADQAKAALTRFAELNGGTDPATLRECYDLDAQAFGSLIEALAALRVPIDPEMIRLAGLRDVGELLS